ncbi:MAG: hypothetical protein Q8P57_02605 [Candidatus Pacearchaeota archaeon]|nr:hypothetical protein [Candidatus Pacearchaeota archaeon]
MGLLELLLIYFSSNLVLLSLIAGFLSEDLFLFVIILSGVGFLKLEIIVLFGFIGVLIHDAVIYFLAKSSIVKKINGKLKFQEKNRMVKKLINNLDKREYLGALIFSKFIYGARIGFVIYLAHREHSLKKFLLFNGFACFIWFLIMVPLGWLAGQGILRLLYIAKGIEKIFVIILIVILIGYVLRKFISFEFLKSKN